MGGTEDHIGCQNCGLLVPELAEWGSHRREQEIGVPVMQQHDITWTELGEHSPSYLARLTQCAVTTIHRPQHCGDALFPQLLPGVAIKLAPGWPKPPNRSAGEVGEECVRIFYLETPFAVGQSAEHLVAMIPGVTANAVAGGDNGSDEVRVPLRGEAAHEEGRVRRVRLQFP